MIVCKTPLRITLGGGGTDLKSFYSKYSGLCLTATIDKYIYVCVHNSFENNYLLKYSNFEKKNTIKEIQHPIIRETLKKFKQNRNFLEIASFADIPGGTGLGSSSCFTVALINSIKSYNNIKISNYKTAEDACDIEINKLNLPIGKQDQFACSLGGLNALSISSNGKVKANKIRITKKNSIYLQHRIGLYFTGKIRKKHNILKHQNNDTKKNNKKIINNLIEIKKMGKKSLQYLENENFENFGKLLDEHWKLKMQRSKFMSDSKINSIYNFAIKNSSLGGKLIGAGGAGFLMFYAEDQNYLSKKLLKKFNLKRMNFKFEFKGSEIIHI